MWDYFSPTQTSIHFLLSLLSEGSHAPVAPPEMSSNDQAAAAALAQVALACDGAFLGITLAIVAVQTILKFKYSSKALAKIRGARSLSVSDIRSVVPPSGDDKSSEGDQTLVVVRGRVQPRSAVEGNWIGLRDNVLVSTESGERAVVIQRTQTCLYNEWRGLFGWTFDLHNIFLRTKKAHESTSLRAVPFVLTDGDSRLHSCYVVVNLDGSKHPLPLTTAYHQLHPVQCSPYTFFQAMFGHGYPVGLLDEEKILLIGKEISAVGVCNSQNGVPEIKSSKEIPYFLSEMNKEQMEVDLAINTKILLWSGIILGTVSFGILAYSIARNWARFKNWRQQMQQMRERREATTDESVAEDESGDVPDGELCVICLMRRRSSAFIPCGHLVCCPRCAFSVESDTNPKCPVCRQAVRTCVRIYAS